MPSRLQRGRVVEPPIYDRNDLTAPAFDITTDQGRITSWSSAGAAEWAGAIITACHARGGHVRNAWINPGPDFCGATAPILIAAE